MAIFANGIHVCLITSLLMEDEIARITGVSRHRLGTDGDGVTTLVVFHGCPLWCRYCLNPHTLEETGRYRELSALELYAETVVDELYFLATGGGVAFGGGEPALHPGFIRQFRELCGDEWRLTLETSLNVARENIEALLPVVDRLIIDVKDMNPEIYRAYTGRDNSRVEVNLRLIADVGRQEDCLVRIPFIAGFNTDADRERSRQWLVALGFSRFDFFNYKLRDRLWQEERKSAGF